MLFRLQNRLGSLQKGRLYKKVGEDMYCSNCGKQTDQDARFCPACGTEMSQDDGTPVDIGNQANELGYQYAQPDGQEVSRRTKRGMHEATGPEKKKWQWILPTSLLVVVVLSLASFYFYEQHQTKAALAHFKQGESLAIKGDYLGALTAFNQSLNLRSHFSSAANDKKVVMMAMKVDSDLKAASELQKKNNYAEALNHITSAENRLDGYKGKVVDQLTNAVIKQRTTTMVAQLRYDMKGKTSEADLAPILQRAEALKVPEAKAIADEIRKQLVESIYDQANSYLKERHYSKALASIEDGLKYSPDDKKLTTLKATVTKAKQAFEAAQQQKIKQAMAAAAKEEANNQTNAVKLLDVKATLDQFGDVVIDGNIQSIATVPISGVEVFYTLYDSDGNEYDTNSVYVDTYLLYPGDKSTFEYTHYNAGQNLTVKVTGFTWYLEN